MYAVDPAGIDYSTFERIEFEFKSIYTEFYFIRALMIDNFAEHLNARTSY